MNHDETTALLRTRSALTSQPYSADVADAWHAALADWPYSEIRAALVRAARQHTRITVAHVVEHLSPRPTPPPPNPPDEDRADVIDLAEYLSRVQRRAENGNTDAGDDLEVWNRHLHPRRRHPSNTEREPF